MFTRKLLKRAAISMIASSLVLSGPIYADEAAEYYSADSYPDDTVDEESFYDEILLDADSSDIGVTETDFVSFSLEDSDDQASDDPDEEIFSEETDGFVEEGLEIEDGAPDEELFIEYAEEDSFQAGEGTPEFDGEMRLVGGPLDGYGENERDAVLAGLSDIGASTVKTNCTVYNGENVECQNYLSTADPVKSYLTTAPDGRLMRVQAEAVDGKLLVEYYDWSYNYQGSRTVDLSLPLFGGFYEGPDAYYVLTGQENPNQSDNVTVFRVSKYTKSWDYVTSADIKGANTTLPFCAGSARFAMCGKYLLIRTCHLMYKSSDGVSHQANVTIQIDSESMSVVDYYAIVMNAAFGYVSHSFNQFILADGDTMVALDHGDAYPRSIVMMKYPKPISGSSFVPNRDSGYCENTSILSFPGEIGDNYTGASVGGFQLSATHYLVAGNQDVNFDHDDGCRNAFIASVPKSGGEPTVRFVTSYAGTNDSASTPHLVKIDENTFILMWSSQANVYYMSIGGDGQPKSGTYSLKGNLSDCVPYLSGNKLIWYTWSDSGLVFYEISTDNLSNHDAAIILNGHKIGEGGKIEEGVLTGVCTTCGKAVSLAVPTDVDVYWSSQKSSNTGWYTSGVNTEMKPGDKIEFEYDPVFSSNLSDKMRDVVVTSTDPSVISVSENADRCGVISAGQNGKATVKFQPLYNKSATVKYTFYVNCINENSVELESGTGFYKSYPYTGKAIQPQVYVEYAGTKLVKDKDYTVKYSDNIKVGNGKVTVTGIGQYTGNVTIKFKIYKDSRKAQPMTVKAKAANVRKKNGKQTIKMKDIFTIANAKGAVSFKKKSGSKQLSISKNGKVTVAKGTKKGSYKIKVEVSAAGDWSYKAGSKTVTVKVRVK